MAERILELRDLTIVSDGGVRIVDAVSFSLDHGRMLGVIGESGAGKTTLGLAALGHLRPGTSRAGGRLFFRGRDLLALPAREIGQLRGQRIAYVAQSAASAFNPALGLLDQIIEPLLRSGSPRAQALARADEVLSALRLPNAATLARRHRHELSGGQLQRAMIAMALLPRPELLVFDEPTTALDGATQAEVVGAIRQAMALTGAAALFISHDLPLVSGLADDLVVLRGGRTVEVGPAARIARAPASDYARQLLAAHELARPPRAAPPPQPVLEVSGLAVGHAGAPALIEGLGFAIRAGETLAVTGPSGIGKSTLARAVAGLLPARSGTILLNGKPLSPVLDRRSGLERAAIQMINQNPDAALNPHHSVRAILKRGLRLTGRAADPARLETLMRDVGLDPALLDRRPLALSGGQKQRVCIARALASEPALLICDEPTASLDPLVAKGVLETLARLQAARGTACLLITHDRKLVQHFADRECAIGPVPMPETSLDPAPVVARQAALMM